MFRRPLPSPAALAVVEVPAGALPQRTECHDRRTAALRATVRQARRRAAAERLIQRGESGYFDELLTEHPEPGGHEDVDAPAPAGRGQGAA